MRWVEALKIWNAEHNPGKWCVAKKGTKEYDEVKAIMAKDKIEKGGKTKEKPPTRELETQKKMPQFPPTKAGMMARMKYDAEELAKEKASGEYAKAQERAKKSVEVLAKGLARRDETARRRIAKALLKRALEKRAAKKAKEATLAAQAKAKEARARAVEAKKAAEAPKPAEDDKVARFKALYGELPKSKAKAIKVAKNRDMYEAALLLGGFSPQKAAQDAQMLMYRADYGIQVHKAPKSVVVSILPSDFEVEMRALEKKLFADVESSIMSGKGKELFDRFAQQEMERRAEKAAKKETAGGGEKETAETIIRDWPNQKGIRTNREEYGKLIRALHEKGYTVTQIQRAIKEQIGGSASLIDDTSRGFWGHAKKEIEAAIAKKK